MVTNLNTHFNRVKIYSSLWDTKVAKEILTMNNTEMTKSSEKLTCEGLTKKKKKNSLKNDYKELPITPLKYSKVGHCITSTLALL